MISVTTLILIQQAQSCHCLKHFLLSQFFNSELMSFLEVMIEKVICPEPVSQDISALLSQVGHVSIHSCVVYNIFHLQDVGLVKFSNEMN